MSRVAAIIVIILVVVAGFAWAVSCAVLVGKVARVVELLVLAMKGFGHVEVEELV